MNKLPKVTFRAMNFNENMDMIAMFIYIEKDREIKTNTIYFKNKYSEIKDIDFDNMNRKQIKELLTEKLFNIWNEEMKNSKEIIEKYQSNWNLINDSLMLDLSNRLNIRWPLDALNITARVGVMYSCPRYISKRMFDTGIKMNLNRMREIAIHEICHFLYFEKWKELYNDYDESHYNIPNIIWYLSEAIIDPLLNNDVFRKYTSINIYSYKEFYDTLIDGVSIIDRLRKIVNQNSIEDAIKESYKFFLEKEQLIVK